MNIAKYLRIGIYLVLDLCIVNISYIFALLLRFDFDTTTQLFDAWIGSYASCLVGISAVSILAFGCCGVYHVLWRYAGVSELGKLALAAGLAQIFTKIYLTLRVQPMSGSIHVLAFFFTFTMLLASRYLALLVNGDLLTRLRRTAASQGGFATAIKERFSEGGRKTRVMVVGAGQAGAAIIKEIRYHNLRNLNPEGDGGSKKVVVAIDDDPAKIRSRVCGVKVFGGTHSIRHAARRYKVDEIIIAIPSAGKKAISQILEECNKTRCKTQILPSLMDLISEKVSISQLRDVEIQDFLGREPANLLQGLRRGGGQFEGKIVLITGAGGFVGSQLARVVGAQNPRRVILLDLHENSLYRLYSSLNQEFPKVSWKAVVASVKNRERMEEIFETYKPHLVYHGATRKQVQMMEENPGEALESNLLGTWNLLELAEDHAAEKFVLISNLEAAEPVNVAGASMRAAEMVVQKAMTEGHLVCSVARLGKVLGSGSSVVPLFRRQIAKGGPVVVKSPDAAAYFMTADEAVGLIIQASMGTERGLVYVLNMGRPVNIMELAEKVIMLSGFVPKEDIDIQFSGLGPGEKLCDQLMNPGEPGEFGESDIVIGGSRIFVGYPLPENLAMQVMLEGADQAETLPAQVRAVCGKSSEEIKAWLAQLVPEYKAEPAENQ